MRRRHFLSAAGAATAVAVLSPVGPGRAQGDNRSRRLFLNTAFLGGTPEENLEAARSAGFDEVEFWRDEVERAEGRADGVRALAERLAIGFTDYQVLLDFDGAPGEKRAGKRAEALAMLDEAVAIGAPALAMPASTDPDCDASRVAEDLEWIVGEARRRGLRISYEGMAWSTVNPVLGDAWRAIRDLDPETIGLVVDSYHLLVRGGGPQDLDGIPVGRIAAVQFGDVAEPVAPADYATVARSRRLLPGDGDLPLGALAAKLRAIGYRGPTGLEVFNDRMKAEAPDLVARRAMASLRPLL